MSRGKLRILLGAAPGAGKSFAMLEEGRRLRLEGADLVVGAVSVRGRAETGALLHGLELCPAPEIGPAEVMGLNVRAVLVEGKIYSTWEETDAALAGDFRIGTLAALRELALLWLAERVDAGLSDYRILKNIRDSWPARETIVVGVSGKGQEQVPLEASPHRGLLYPRRGAAAMVMTRAASMFTSSTMALTRRTVPGAHGHGWVVAGRYRRLSSRRVFLRFCSSCWIFLLATSCPRTCWCI